MLFKTLKVKQVLKCEEFKQAQILKCNKLGYHTYIYSECDF